ncbi:MAG: hypothetical protein CVU00_08700 [Bacteroidetes bacterium HGW-Bacteroidetes-17]|nr:MAG: hypothetical protein CVU00_08700 [Bacteroidetes bacterium HGW-Bacteroidetes-17]
MIKNYFKTAFRNIGRNKLFTFLNILGLSLGLATAILILFWVQDELSFDCYHKNAKNIYRITGDYNLNGSRVQIAVASPPMAATMIHDYPEVENACRFRQTGSRIIGVGDQKFKVENITYADSTFFDLFDIPVFRVIRQIC